MLQKEPAEGQSMVSLILLTQKVQERNMNNAIAEIEALNSIQGAVIRIRMEHLK